MLKGFLFFGFMFFFLMVIAMKSMRTVKEGEYGAIFRLGKLLQVHGPGRIMIIPFIDKVVTIPVNHIANWQTMPRDELEKKVAEMALRD